jgi:Tol biopolymer transport system component
MLKVLPLFLFGLSLFAQDGDIPLWLRYPAISPDGATIVFSYQGDLYSVPTEGGLARQLTTYDGHDTRPVWSRDGKRIAFASDRYGNMDVFVMAANGSNVKRLTFHSSNDFPSDFSPDNQHVLFTSTRTDDVSNIQFPNGRLPETYQVSVASGSVRMISTIAMDEPHYDKRGKRIVYQDLKGYEDVWRKHHTSAVTRDIWIYDVDNGSYSQVLDRAGEDRSPVFSPDGQSIYYLSEENGTFNVYKLNPADGSRNQLTQFENHPVRFLTVAENGALCFTFDGEIYTMREGSQPQKLAVQMIRETGGRQIERVAVNRGAGDLAVSPTGKEVAFIFRGEVYVTSVESNTTKRITRTAEQERSVSFHPKGRKLLYAGERDGSWNLYETAIARDEEKYFFNATLLNEETLLQSDAETFQPSYSPDGKEVAFLEDRTTLRVINLESKDVRTVLPGTYNFSYADGDQYYQWSPDSKWFLVSYLQPNFWSGEVGLLAADGKSDPINLTQSGYGDFGPKWMMGGKMMMWFSGRDGLESHANTGGDQSDVYAMFFTRDAYDRFLLSKEEFELLKEQEKEEKEKKKKEEKDKKDEEKKEEKDKKEDKDKDKVEPLKMELEDISDRKVRLTIHSSRLADAVVTPDGEKLLYLARVEKGHDLWQTETRTKDTKILAKLGSRGGSLALDKEGKHLFMLANGRITRIEISSGKRKSIGFSGEMTLDRTAERAYLFEHVWRQVREKFYLTDLHGAKWDYLKESYSQIRRLRLEMSDRLCHLQDALRSREFKRLSEQIEEAALARSRIYKQRLRAYEGEKEKSASWMLGSP